MKEMNEKKYDIFISYRRDGGEVMARLLYIMLSDKGYSVFYDRVSIKTGRFDETIKDAIEKCTDFILILSPDMFKGRTPENDEVIKEVKIARENNKNILPLQMQGFQFPTEEEYKMPEGLEDFNLINAPQIKIDMFNYEYISSYMKAEKSNFAVALSEILKEADFQKEIFKQINKEIRDDALRNILNSYMASENTEMILNMIKPYLNKNFNEKKDFRYTLSLSKYVSQLKKLPIPDMDGKYYRLSERLSFVKHYIKSDGIDELWVAYDFESGSLDEDLRKENVFFSESLKLQKEDIELLKSATEENLYDWYENVFKVQVAINGSKRKCDALEINSSGIYAKYKFDGKLSEIRFKISFEIPFDANNNHIHVAISEPTYSPEILVKYDDVFETEMIPFFDDAMTLKDSAGFEGEYEFSAPNTWVMPMSGAVIKVKVKKQVDR